MDMNHRYLDDISHKQGARVKDTAYGHGHTCDHVTNKFVNEFYVLYKCQIINILNYFYIDLPTLPVTWSHL